MAQRRNAQIDEEYEMIAKTLESIESGSDLANQLNDQLDHEKLVLEQKKQVFIAISLSMQYFTIPCKK